MRRGTPLPAEIEHRLATLGTALADQPSVRFAYVFGGAGRGELRSLTDRGLRAPSTYAETFEILVQAG
jgi:hypothetical protein